MILFINVFLTDKRHSSFDRGRFGEVDALAAFRYMLRSLTDLDFSRAYIFAELDPDDYGADFAHLLRAEVEALFRGTPLDFRSKRLLALRDWQHFIVNQISHQSEPIFYSGNHDHIFMDHDTKVLDACLGLMERLRARFDCVSLIMSHWAEYFSYRSRLQLQETFGFVHTSNYRDAMQVLTPKLLETWFIHDSAHLPAETAIRRTEDLGWRAKGIFPQIIPGRELFRHIDGSSFFGVRIDHVSPLRIPPGLLNGQLKLACLAEPDLAALRHYQSEGYCCISPYFPSLACAADGVDFHWLPDEIPSFLRRNAVEILQPSEISMDVVRARDDRYASMLKDMFPISVEALRRLSPLAVRASSRNQPLTIEQPIAGGRRTESLLSLKLPRGPRKVGIVVIGTQGHLPEPTFWRSLDLEVLHPVYVWVQERADHAWHVQASAIQMAGDLHDRISGLYSYLFDFAANAVTPLRFVLRDLACETVVLINQNSLGLAGVSNWIQGVQEKNGNSLLIGLGGEGPTMLALHVPKIWLHDLLEAYPDLYCAESMSLIEVLLYAAEVGDRLPELEFHQVDVGSHAISAPAVSLLF